MLQSTFNDKPAKGVVGRRANMEEWNGFTAHPLASGVVGVAYPVQNGGTAEQQITVFTSGGNFVGITELDTFDTPGEFYEKGQNVPVCEMGVINGLAIGVCTNRTPVYWSAASKGYTSTAASNLRIPGAEFDDSAVAGEPVRIRLRRQVPTA